MRYTVIILVYTKMNTAGIVPLHKDMTSSKVNLTLPERLSLTQVSDSEFDTTEQNSSVWEGEKLFGTALLHFLANSSALSSSGPKFSRFFNLESLLDRECVPPRRLLLSEPLLLRFSCELCERIFLDITPGLRNSQHTQSKTTRAKRILA